MKAFGMFIALFLLMYLAASILAAMLGLGPVTAFITALACAAWVTRKQGQKV